MKKRDMVKIYKVVKRIIKEGLAYDDMLSMEMDIDAVNEEIGLDLNKFLQFDKFNFAHDIYGIAKNLNRRTKKLDNCFLPRCSSGKESKECKID